MPHFRLEVGVALVLLYCSFYFYRYAHRKNSLAFTLLAMSLALWSVLMLFGQFSNSYVQLFDLLGPIPQLSLGIAMVMVLAENERNAVQENALAFSTLGVDPTRLLSADDLVPSMQSILDRLVAPLPAGGAVICISERWRAVLPSVQRNFSPDFLGKLEKSGAGEYVCELAYRRGGFVTFRNVPEMSEPLPVFPGGRFTQFRQVLTEERIYNVTAVSLQTREHNFGVILFPHAARRMFGSSNLRLLIGLALQIGLTLENYVVMHDAQRRTKEFALLTEIGQAISSRLDQDEILRTVQKELGQIFDTSDFYIAFQEGDEIRFELEVEKGETLPKRSRKVANGLTEYMIRSGQPLLIRAELEKTRERLGVTFVPPRPAKCFCGAPILLGGRPAGVMAAMNTDREYVFEQRDLEVMQTAAGQVSVAVENARLFAEEQRRSRQFAFLNNISKTAISSEDSEQMLADIVGHIQKNFSFDHIGIGILDYVTKDIEIKAEAGITAQALGKRIPLGVGILGPRGADRARAALVQTTGDAQLQGVMPGARSVLCIPIAYGESLLGVLNVESQKEDAFTAAGPADHEYPGRSAGHCAAQRFRVPETAAAIHHRRAYRHQDAAILLRGAQFGVEARFALRTPHLGGADGPGQVQGSERHQGTPRRRPGAGPRGAPAGAEVPAVERGGALRRRRIHHPHAGDRSGTGADPGRTPAPVDRAGSGAQRAPHYRQLRRGQLSRCTDSPWKTLFASPTRACTFPSTPAATAYRPPKNLPEGETAAVRRQLISGYIEGFLQREHTGPEHVEELISTLKKMVGEGDRNALVLREAIETLTSAAESRELNSAGHGEMVARYSEIIARSLGPAAGGRSPTWPSPPGCMTWARSLFPKRILNKPGPLTEDEFYVLKMHAQVGGEILATSARRQEIAGGGAAPPRILRWRRLSRRPARREDPAVGAHPVHHRRVCEHDQRAVVCRRQDQRTGAGGAGKNERHPLRRHAGAHSAARTQD